MLLVAMARPRKIRLDDETDVWFDGKIGLWPCIQTTLAQRDFITVTSNICVRPKIERLILLV